MYKDFIIGFSTGYINTILYYPAFTITHQKFHNNQNFNLNIKKIYNDNGIRGFYSGLLIFSIYLPLIRGGDIYFQKKFENFTESKSQNIAIASFYSNIWKFVIYPLNTLQINKQVLNNYDKIKLNTLWNGYTYNLFSGLISNFTWFYTYNYINNGYNNDSIIQHPNTLQ